jgi:hypothetical protein
MKKSITYFQKPGATNTGETLRLAYERAMDVGITDIIIGTIHGSTALKAAELFTDPKFNVVAVTISEGYEDEGWIMTPKEKARLQNKGIKVFTGTHALGGDVNAALTDKFGGKTLNAVVAETLYRFCQGMKVCVEIALMAADAGFISVKRDVVAIAGTGEGADTAVIIKPSYPRKFLGLKVKEIIAKPIED